MPEPRALSPRPHANTEYRWDLAVNEARIAEVQKAVGNRIRIYSGCDFHLTFDNVNDAIQNPTKYTINHKQWLLVEFSDLVIFQNSGEILAPAARGRDAAHHHPSGTEPDSAASFRHLGSSGCRKDRICR